MFLTPDFSGVKMEIYKDYKKDYEDCQTEFWSLCKGLRKHPKLHKEFLDQHTSIIEDAELEMARQDFYDSFYPECGSSRTPMENYSTIRLINNLKDKYQYKLLIDI